MAGDRGSHQIQRIEYAEASTEKSPYPEKARECIGIKPWLFDSMRKNSLFLMMNGVLGTGIGALFWLVAARFLLEAEIGKFSAVISFVNLAVSISGIGLATGLIRYLPGAGQKERNKLLSSSILITSILAASFSIVYFIGLPIWSSKMTFLYSFPILIFGVIFLTILKNISSILASAFISLRESKFVIFKETLFNILKVTFLPFLVFLGMAGLMVSWLLALLISVGLSAYIMAKSFNFNFNLIICKFEVSRILSFSLGNYIVSFLTTLPSFALPLIFINILTPEETAQFYITWMIGNVLLLAPRNIGMSLFAEGSNRPDSIHDESKKSLIFIYQLIIPLSIIFWFFGDSVLRLFGESYSNAGFSLLKLLIISVFFMAIKSTFIAVKRVEKNIREMIEVELIIAIATISITYYLIPAYGITSAGIGWLVGLLLAVIFIASKNISNKLKNKNQL